MKQCEMCEFGNCVWPDCERAEALQFIEVDSLPNKTAMLLMWGGMMAFTVAFWSLVLAWVF